MRIASNPWTWLCVPPIVVLLYALFLPEGGGNIPAAKRLNTELRASILKAASSAYYSELKRPPSTTENSRLVAELGSENPLKIAFTAFSEKELSPNKEIIDGWNTPFRFELTSNVTRPLRIISAGKDRIFGTKDDLVTE
jgi:type II secretory pathway pseudopilin PulG